MAISIQEHSKALASKIVGRFIEDKPVRAGFSGFFPRETAATKLVDIEVQRGADNIAVDVKRFTNGNKNKFNITTEKKFQPPYYREEYDFQEDEVYMNSIALGVGLENPQVNAVLAQNALKNLRTMRAKVERAIRKQHVEVLTTGIVELDSQDSIDYKRKAASMVDLGAGNYWNQGSTNPYVDLQTAGKFLRDEGNASGNTLNVVGRSDAITALLANEAFQEETNARRINRADIVMPQFNETSGFTYHGQFAAGDFIINAWTYNEKYTDSSGNTQYYLPKEKVVCLPEDFMGKTVFGGLPNMVERQISGATTMMPSIAEVEFLLRGYSDEKTMSSTLELTSAPLVIPFTIDKIYTLQVLASS